MTEQQYLAKWVKDALLSELRYELKQAKSEDAKSIIQQEIGARATKPGTKEWTGSYNQTGISTADKRQYHREYMRKARASGKWTGVGVYGRMTKEQKEKARQRNNAWYKQNKERKMAYAKVYRAIHAAKCAKWDAESNKRAREKRRKEKKGKKDA